MCLLSKLFWGKKSDNNLAFAWTILVTGAFLRDLVSLNYVSLFQGLKINGYIRFFFDVERARVVRGRGGPAGPRYDSDVIIKVHQCKYHLSPLPHLLLPESRNKYGQGWETWLVRVATLLLGPVVLKRRKGWEVTYRCPQ